MDARNIKNLSHSEAEALAWQFLLAARDVVSQPDVAGVHLGYDNNTGRILRSDSADEMTYLWLDEKGDWCRKSELPLICQTSFDLYLPALGNRVDNHRITAHLGQSIDARIATSNGDSFYVTGEENRKHLHCLRALCDAVIVGSGTVVADDPQLTTRSVPGINPVRVIIDPQARLQAPLNIFNDGQVRTILVHQSSANLAEQEMQFGPTIVDHTGNSFSQVERWVVPDTDKGFSVRSLVALLASRGLRRLFVEGGGITVSGFFEACVLDRLHVAVAPLLVGAGTQALQIAGVAKMMQAHRPPHAIYRMGDDVLWDFDVSAMKTDDSPTALSGENSVVKQMHERLSRPPLERIV